jgi:hypothetical protein
MSAEALLAAGYATALVVAALVLEWLYAHTHRRSLRYRTAGFEYDTVQDHWQCPEGQHLWPHEFDHERRLVRYRAKAHICNGCPRKSACTDSDRGREIVDHDAHVLQALNRPALDGSNTATQPSGASYLWWGWSSSAPAGIVCLADGTACLDQGPPTG